MYIINYSTRKDMFFRICEAIYRFMREKFPDHVIKIHIERDEFNRGRVVTSEDDTYSDIKIGTDFLSNKYWKNYYKERFGTFLNSLNLELNDMTVFAICLLHECGHVAHYEISEDPLYFKRMYYCNDAISGIFRINRYEDDIHTTKTRVLRFPNELYADRFAFENFMYIWNEVKV